MPIEIVIAIIGVAGVGVGAGLAYVLGKRAEKQRDLQQLQQRLVLELQQSIQKAYETFRFIDSSDYDPFDHRMHAKFDWEHDCQEVRIAYNRLISLFPTLFSDDDHKLMKTLFYVDHRWRLNLVLVQEILLMLDRHAKP